MGVAGQRGLGARKPCIRAILRHFKRLGLRSGLGLE